MARKPPLRVVGGGGFTPPDDVERLAKDKLASSGLTPIDAKLLGIVWHTAAETVSITPTAWPLPSLHLPYFTPNSAHTPLSSAPGALAFYRIRCLREPVPMPADFAKYLQSNDSGCCAYFPRNIDWDGVIHDVSVDLIITEGELKAAKAAIEGFTAIGLGGVNSFKANRLGHMEFLPELGVFKWVWRRVTLIYDSDVMTNPRVCAALNDIGEALVDRGAVPRMVILPPKDDGSKMGLDDFLVEHGAERLKRMIENDSMHVTIAKTLHDLNRDYAYVLSMGERIIRQGIGYLISPSAMKATITAKVLENHITPGGVRSEKKMNAAAKWLTWPIRQDVQRLDYLPGAEPQAIVPDPYPRHPRSYPLVYNTWTGWGTEPKKGSVAPFTKLYDHLFTGATDAFKHRVLQWLAYPIQHPGTKLFTSLVIYGREQGTGKSLIGYSVGRIYGKNFTEISQADLGSAHNEWAINRQFVMGDDVTGSDKRQDLDMLKKMITQKEIRINPKNVPAYTVLDPINYTWTSNHADAFFLEDNDRRFDVHEVTVAPLPRAFYVGYMKWLDGEGANALHHYLLNYDLTGFDAQGPAMSTPAKEAMKRAGRTELGNWVRDLLAEPDGMLVMKGGAPMIGDLFTTANLMGLFTNHVGEDEARRMNTKRMSMELNRAGCSLVNGGTQVRLKGVPGRERYYAIRNRAKWDKATLEQIQAHLQGEDKPVLPKKKPRF
jgi:hypothetical protein